MPASQKTAVIPGVLSGFGVLIVAGLSFGQSVFGQVAPDTFQRNQSFAPRQSYAPPQPPLQETGQQVLSPDQLDNLVAPIALYPDPLLSQVLAASTYPLEIVEAQQWLQQHLGLRGSQLIDAARQINWDPSVQALVAFPDVLAMLNRDVQWTTDLGNAFLAQQSEALAAIQRMRAAAQQNGRLASTPQQVVGNDVQVDPQYGQGAIQIQPANPQVMYAPTYNPEYVWGPPQVGAYPPLGYPSDGYGLGFGVATLVGSLFTGLLSFGGWGWGLSWLTHSLLLNGLFFSHFGFGGAGFGGGGYGGHSYAGGYARSYSGPTVWAHNPSHRLGVPYSNQSVALRFGGSYSARSAGFGGYRGVAQPAGNSRSLGSSGAGSYNARSEGPYVSRGSQAYGGYNSGSYRGFSGASSYENRGATPGYGGSGYAGSGHGESMGFREESRGYAAPTQSYSRSYSSPSAPSRTYGYAAPSYGNLAPRVSSPEYSSRSYAPSSSFGGNFSQRAFGGGGGHFSAPKSSGHFSSPSSSGGGHSSGHSSKGHSGGHSGGGHHR
jgi:hypothetical protein